MRDSRAKSPIHGLASWEKALVPTNRLKVTSIRVARTIRITTLSILGSSSFATGQQAF